MARRGIRAVERAAALASLLATASSSGSTIAALASSLATASSSGSDPFARFEYSWALPPVQAFPGAASRMMTDAEVDGFTRNFSLMMIWGLNTTCLSPADNVTTFPAYCSDSWCQCFPDRGHPLEQQRFVAAMDAALQAQGAALKARAAALGLAPRPTLGYIDFTSPQQTFFAQNQLREDPALGALRCALESPATGLIDCMAPAPKGGCCEQGSEFSMYDFRQQAARDYFVAQVLPPLIDGDGLDGTFLDSIDWFLTFGCGGRWVCTDAERDGLVAGSLQALDASLAYAASKGKLLSVSSHNSLGVNRAFYEAQLAMIAAHGNAWRFYEGFEVTPDGMATYLYEAQGMNVTAGGAPTSTNYSVPVMMHTGYDGRHDAPDWVELAAFLVGASENSYFSFSGGWDIGDFPVEPEFLRPLGAPLGPPTVTRNESLLPPWAPIAGLNVVFSLPPSPGANASNAVFLGLAASPAACAALAEARGGNVSAYTHTLDGSQWDRTCYARTDDPPLACFTPGGAALGPPCWSSFGSKGAASGAAQRVPAGATTVYAREFEHVSVRLVEESGGASYGATLAWR